MRKLLLIIFFYFITGCITGCSSSIQSRAINKELQLKDYKTVYIGLFTAGSAISQSGVGSLSTYENGSNIFASSVQSGQTMIGNEQVIMALQDIGYAMRGMGFETFVESKADSVDLIALFSIGTVRYDPLAGWIADRALLRIIERKTEKTLVEIKAETQFITPTVKNLVKSIIKELKKYS